jgi:hypothetical protein
MMVSFHDSHYSPGSFKADQAQEVTILAFSVRLPEIASSALPIAIRP